MKLKSFCLRNFKNIKDKTLECADGNYTTLVGLNGSGKSNWIEAVANVFSHLYGDKKFEFDFSLIYELDGEIYEIHKLDEDVEVPGDIVFPDRVIACYSGEDTRLWTMSFAHAYDKFFDDLLKGGSYEPEMLYLNKSSWDIALVALLCSEDVEVKNFVSLIFGSDGNIDLRKFKVKIKLLNKNIETFKDTRVKNLLLDRFLEQEEYDMTTFSTWDIDDTGDNKKKCQFLYFMLYSALMPDALGSTRAKKAIDTISISYDGMDAASLSEGNKKQILIELATKILGTTNTLYLFDEPDAHSHISAKGDICKLIENAEGYSLISTHSPSFIAKMKPECIRPILNGEPNNHAANLLKTISEVSNGEISYIDGALITSEKKVLVTEVPYDIKYINKAIEVLSPDYDRLKEIYKISMNGADATVDFLENVICGIKDYIERVVFVFDRDKEGCNNCKIVNDRTSEFGNKIVGIKYSDDFSKDTDGLYYVENYFGDSWRKFNHIDKTISNGVFSDIKGIGNVTKAVKTTFERHYQNIPNEYWQNFRPLLDELKKQFGF